MCECDLDSPAIYEEKIRIARRKHLCCECGCTIMTASQYVTISGLWDGAWSNFKSCLRCHELAQRYMQQTACCHAIGGLYDELEESDFLEYDRKSGEWRSTVDWLKVANQWPLTLLALPMGGEWGVAIDV